MAAPNTPTSWIDGHLDLAYIALDGTEDAPSLDRVLDPKLGCVSWETLARGGLRTCFGTIFTGFGEPEHPCGYRDHDDRDGAHEAGARQLELYERWEREGHLVIVRSTVDLERAMNGAGPPAIVLLMECADPIRSPDEASWWADRGIAMVGMSWSHGSRYAGGNSRAGGLTDEGRELVAALDEAGVAHDVSHLADRSVEDLLGCARGPIASTHSNARSLLPNSTNATRHLTDDHAREIAARGGVAGVNLYSRFLAEGRRATIQDVLAHIDWLAGHFTRHRVGLGSDMDGGFGPDLLPVGLEGPDQLAPLDDALVASGWNDEERQAFRTDAWLGFLERVPCLAR